jgi:hypothetical protein
LNYRFCNSSQEQANESDILLVLTSLPNSNILEVRFLYCITNKPLHSLSPEKKRNEIFYNRINQFIANCNDKVEINRNWKPTINRLNSKEPVSIRLRLFFSDENFKILLDKILRTNES